MAFLCVFVLFSLECFFAMLFPDLQRLALGGLYSVLMVFPGNSAEHEICLANKSQITNT